MKLKRRQMALSLLLIILLIFAELPFGYVGSAKTVEAQGATDSISAAAYFPNDLGQPISCDAPNGSSVSLIAPDSGSPIVRPRLLDTRQTQQVALVPNRYGAWSGAGPLPTSYAGITFTDLAVSAVIASNLAAFDTVVLYQICDIATALSSGQKADLLNWLYGGGKLIIYDSDACGLGSGPTPDYSWFIYPFSTDTPGQQGAHAGVLTIVENNTLSNSDPSSPYYIDTGDIAVNTDAVGDSNVMISRDPHWCGDMESTNVHGVTGWVHTYAGYGNGLVIYNGLDTDYIDSNVPLARVWEFELRQPWNPSGLPCAEAVEVPPPSSVFGGASSNPNAPFSQEPVNLAIGNYTYQHTDLSIPGRGFSLSFIHSYNSQDDYDGPLGHGWTHNYNMNLILGPSSPITPTTPITYTWANNQGQGTGPPPTYDWIDVSSGTIVAQGDDTYQQVSLGFPFSFYDNTYTSAYVGSNGFVTFGAGSSTYSNTSIPNTSSPNDAIYGFWDDLYPSGGSNGNVYVQQVDATKFVAEWHQVLRYGSSDYETFEIVLDSSDSSILTQYQSVSATSSATVGVEDATGITATQYVYNTADVISDGLAIRFDPYIPSPTPSLPITITVMNYDGRRDTYSHAPDGSYTPPPGIYATLTPITTADTISYTLTTKDQTSFNFDADGKLVSIVDRNSNELSLSYDASGYLAQVTDASGRSLDFNYDANRRIASVVDPAGRALSYGYDANGDLTSFTDPAGGVTLYTYDAQHRMTSITDPRGNQIMGNTYDTMGRVLAQDNALGVSTTFAYITSTLTTIVTDPLGHDTAYAYDSRYRTTAVTDTLGSVVTYTYDTNNNRTGVSDANGHSTEYAYDTNGNVTAIIDALGHVTTMTYDTANNLTSKVDALGRQTTYDYDAQGNLISVTHALGGQTTFRYDGYGQIISTTDANGNTTTFGYDSYGNQTAISDALGNTVTLVYDIVGRQTSQTDANGHTTYLTYDALDRLTSITDALGHITSYTYDANGNKTSIVDANGNTTNYAYDALDQLVTVIDALGGTVHYTYDANGNKTSMTDGKGHTTTYGYDALGRLTSVTDPLGHSTTYAYDAAGNKVSATDANGNRTTYDHDALDRLVQITYDDGSTVNYSYDAVGSRTSMTDWHGTTSYVYDDLNRLVSVVNPGGETVSYSYDAVGNRISLIYPDGAVVTYRYDSANRLTSVTDWGGRGTAYEYDAVGNRTRTSNPNGTSTTYSYDDANRLVNLANSGPNGLISSFTYTQDSVGNRTQVVEELYSFVPAAPSNLVAVIVSPSQIDLSWTDNSDNESSFKIERKEGAGGTWGQVAAVGPDTTSYSDMGLAVQTTYFYRVKASNPYGDSAYSNEATAATGLYKVYLPIVVKNYGGPPVGAPAEPPPKPAFGPSSLTTRTINYTYDALHRLTKEEYSDGTSISYTYDPMGNRLSITDESGTTNYTYDAGDRLLSAGFSSFTYDNNGNMLSKGSTTYAYDYANRLIRVVSGSSTVELAYDGDGHRVSKSANGEVAAYLYDINAAMPSVIVENDDGSITSYVYGADLIAMVDSDGSWLYYQYDGLGSVRDLADGSGNTIVTYSYYAFGGLQSMVGSSVNTFMFTGQRTDEETGLLYLRARYYGAELGRFLTIDPVAGTDWDSQTVNRYVYVRNNPVLYVDPTGTIYVYCSVGGGVAPGVVGSAQVAVYIDPITGEGELVISGGGGRGGGIGVTGGITGELGVSVRLPQEGWAVQPSFGAALGPYGFAVHGSLPSPGSEGNLAGGWKTGVELNLSLMVMYSHVRKRWSNWEELYKLSILYPYLGQALERLRGAGYFPGGIWPIVPGRK